MHQSGIKVIEAQWYEHLPCTSGSFMKTLTKMYIQHITLYNFIMLILAHFVNYYLFLFHETQVATRDFFKQLLYVD